MSLEKDFVPYKESLELKELGFNEPCVAWINIKGERLSDIILGYGDSYDAWDSLYLNSDMGDSECANPTFSQAFRWFREKHNLKGGIEYIGGLTPETTWWDIYIVGHFNTDASKMTMKYQPYEEAELACLKHLIKIVKNEIQANK